MPAHAGLEDHEIIWISGGERQIVNLAAADGPSRAHARRLNHGRAASNLDRGGYSADLELGIDHALGACGEDDTCVTLRLKTALLYRYDVGAERKIRENVIPVVARIYRARKARLGI